MEQWDPIRVKDAPEAESEYDGYRAAVMQLLRSVVSGEAIAEHLSRVEQERMGFRTTPERCARSESGSLAGRPTHSRAGTRRTNAISGAAEVIDERQLGPCKPVR